MVRLFTLLAWLATCAVAWGDIQVDPQYEPNEPIVATVTITDVPAGAKLRGSFAISDGSYLPAGENVYHVWAAPGKHTVKAAGIWVLTEPVVVGDKTINALVDFGQFAYEKSFTVGPEVPPSPFPPEPTPPGQRWAIVWEESSERTPAQASLYVALRKQFKTDRLLILDVSTLPPAWEVYRKLVPASQVLPALQVLAADKQVRVVSLPASVSEVVKEVSK